MQCQNLHACICLMCGLLYPHLKLKSAWYLLHSAGIYVHSLCSLSMFCSSTSNCHVCVQRACKCVCVCV